MRQVHALMPPVTVGDGCGAVGCHPDLWRLLGPFVKDALITGLLLACCLALMAAIVLVVVPNGFR